MTTPPIPDPYLAQTIARAEQRREVAEQLTGMGMALARAITAGVVEQTGHPNPRHDPNAAFAAVSRAVRLGLRLEEAIDKLILAWRKGEVASLEPGRVVRKPWRRRDPDDGRRVQAENAVREAIDRDVGESDAALRLMETAHARLIWGEDYDALLEGEFDACVAAICRDLGVEPPVVGLGDEDEEEQAVEPCAPSPLDRSAGRAHDAGCRLLRGNKGDLSPHRLE